MAILAEVHLKVQLDHQIWLWADFNGNLRWELLWLRALRKHGTQDSDPDHHHEKRNRLFPGRRGIVAASGPELEYQESWTKALALWVMMGYVFPVFESVPYLLVTGERASGKTKLLSILNRVGFNAGSDELDKGEDLL